MKASTTEWLKERAAFGAGTRAKEILDYIGEIEGRNKELADTIHYPNCWDTMAYPTLLSAIREISNCSICVKEYTNEEESSMGERMDLMHKPAEF